MAFESCSFNIGEQTLMEIERQANFAKTPLSSKPQPKINDQEDLEDDDIIEESPNAKENISSFCHLNLHDRLKNATQRGRKRRKLEKSKCKSVDLPSFNLGYDQTSKLELTSISKYLQVDAIDVSAWEKSAAQLISPCVHAPKTKENLTDYDNLHFDCSATQEISKNSRSHESQDLFHDDELDQAISGDISMNSITEGDEKEGHAICDVYDVDNVSFMQPQDTNLDDRENAQKHIERELEEQKSIFKAHDTFINESVVNTTNNLTNRDHQQDQSLKIDANKNLRFLSNWNLPPSVVNEYRKKNVTEMFEWQSECLKNPKVLFEGANLVYSAPTSAGKTLVSEILMIKNIVERKKKALFILPFVSVVREKMFYLQDLMASSGMRVEGFFGGYHPPGGFDSIDLAVCTIEKANSIINRLLEQDKLSDVGTIVIDEIHLISDSSRGYILELLLTKILYMCEKYQHKIQLVTMSATLPNVELLRKWLKAQFFCTDFRPIELREMIKIGKNIYDEKMNQIRVLDGKWKEFFLTDTDEVCELAMETIMENCQLIIFCPSKDWCEQLCTNLARGIHNMLKTKAGSINEIIDKSRIEILLEQIKGLPSGVDQVLQRSLAYACAFHHAGLTTDERDLIEMGFKDGTLKVLVATSTLSSGVNLPARRVIIRTPMFGKKMMSNLTYRQMIGRAGRKGKDVLGESILVCNETTARVGKQLVVTPLDPISSCLDIDNHAHLKRALLEIIASGVANTKTDLEAFVNSTLFCQDNSISFSYFQDSDIDFMTKAGSKTKKQAEDINNETQEKDPIKSSMDFLLEYEFIRIHVDEETNEIQFVPTRLGLACLSSSLPPKDGFLLFSELQKARQNFVIESELHAIYLVTPFSVAYQLQDLDWIYFAEMHDKLPDMMKRVGEMVGVSATYLIKAITGKQGSDWRAQQIHKRFYTALALQELVNEKSVSEVSAKYKIHRGLLQNLQQMSSTFAGTVTTFCKSLQWNLLALILAQFRERLFFGIHPDLIELMKIPTMSSTRIARALHKNGIEKLNELANCKTLSIENILIDLGGNFVVAGKSMGMSMQEIAKLMINDARSHIQNEMGLKGIKWSQQENHLDPDHEQEVEDQTEVTEISHVQTEPEKRINQREESVKINQFRESTPGNMRKRKAESLLAHSDPTVNSNEHSRAIIELVKIKKADLDVTVEYRKKLRSSGGTQDFVTINSQFMDQLDKKAESEISAMEKSNKNASLFIAQDLEEDSVDESASLLQLTQQHLTMIDVLADEKIFEFFLTEIGKQSEVAMSVGIQKFKLPSQLIGGKLLKSNGTQVGDEHNFTFDETYYIDCISFCYNANRVCYMNLQKKNPQLNQKVEQFLPKLLSRIDLTLNIHEAREHLKVLRKTFASCKQVNVKICDPRLASWLIDPDTNLTWHQMVKKFSPHHLDILELAAKHSTVSSLGLSHVSRVEAKCRTAVECFLSNELIHQQLGIMKSTSKGLLARVFCDLEMPIQLVLMKMEVSGFPINETKLQQMIESSTLLSRQLEQHIYDLHGRKFNLTSSQEVSKVVGIHRNLEKKKRVSTAKNVLEKLDLPIANCIMTWRTLTKTISNMQPMMKLVKNGRIYGNSFSLTQTGRISMYEPNLQNVTKDFNVEFNDQKGEKIQQLVAFRRVFECREGNVLLSADFCQLELRILTHLCKDPTLQKIMNSPSQDIFKKIAAKWNKVDESEVNVVQRNQTKQLCYGIIYGMGNKSLAETMKVDEETSAKLAEEFHATYPGIKSYSQKLIQKTRDQGFIETVTCRRRYLPAIKSENSSERSQAERQALNTCIQGSASDLVKNAILRMDRNIRKQNLDNCQLVMHLHDELFYNVSERKLNEASKILIHSMQNCVKLTVPLLVKLKFGSSWGEMKDFNLEFK